MNDPLSQTTEFLRGIEAALDPFGIGRACRETVTAWLQQPQQLAESMAIARQVATPLQDRYVEIMMYFHRPGRPDTLPPRRVQWTRAAGFVETDLEAQ